MPTPSTQHYSQTLHNSQDLSLYSPELDLEFPTSGSAAYSLIHLNTQAMNESPVIGSLFIRKEFCDRQEANIANRCEKIYGGNLFDVQKNDFGERSKLFSLFFYQKKLYLHKYGLAFG